MTESQALVRRAGGRTYLGAFFLYLVLAVVALWPLVLHLGTVTPTYWGDSRESVWVLAWDAHVLAHHPTGLFQAPVFYPERDSLALMEPHLTPGLLAAPIIWATGNPYLGHNIWYLLAIPLSALAAFALAHDLTGDRRAAIVAGAAYGFSPWWLGHIIPMALIKLMASWWIPWGVFALGRWLGTTRKRWLVLATACLVAADLQSWHLGTMATITFAVVLLVAFVFRAPSRAILVQGLSAAAIAAMVLVPFVIPHVRVTRRDETQVWSVSLIQSRSAIPASFLAAPGENRLWGDATQRWRVQQDNNPEANLFPGVTIIVLALIGLVVSLRRKDSRSKAVMGAALVVVGVLLSLGPGIQGWRRFLPWSLLYHRLFLFRALRTPPRFQIVTILGLSMLVALGARAVIAKVSHKAIMSIALVAFIVLEGLSLPMTLGPAPRPTALDRSLAGRPGSVLYLPTFTYQPRTELIFVHGDPFADLMSTTGNWVPMANGIPSIYTKSNTQLLLAVESFPDTAALAFIRGRGVRTVVVHKTELSGSPWTDVVARLRGVPGVTLIRDTATTNVYDIAPI